MKKNEYRRIGKQVGRRPIEGKPYLDDKKIPDGENSKQSTNTSHNIGLRLAVPA